MISVDALPQIFFPFNRGSQTMKKLPFTYVTTGGKSANVLFPMHPQTRSPEQVGKLLASTLAAMTEQIHQAGDISNGDVLQALAMAMAIRLELTGVERTTGLSLANQLIETAYQATAKAITVPAGHA